MVPITYHHLEHHGLFFSFLFPKIKLELKRKQKQPASYLLIFGISIAEHLHMNKDANNSALEQANFGFVFCV